MLINSAVWAVPTGGFIWGEEALCLLETSGYSTASLWARGRGPGARGPPRLVPSGRSHCPAAFVARPSLEDAGASWLQEEVPPQQGRWGGGALKALHPCLEPFPVCVELVSVRLELQGSGPSTAGPGSPGRGPGVGGGGAPQGVTWGPLGSLTSWGDALLQSPQFDRWSSTSQGKQDALRLRLSAQSGSHLLPFPQPADEDPLSPGYSEPLCYTSSRPPSVETYRLGSRSSSMSSHSRPDRDLRPLSLRYSSPQHPLQPPAEGQVYSTPYAARPRGSPPRPDKAPPHQASNPLCVQSNSWSTPQSSLSYALSSTQRHSDLCPPRQPLSPLYDEPCTPELYAPGPRPLEPRPLEPRPHATQSSWQGSLGLQQTPAPPPPTFKLCTPPLGRRCRRSLVLTGPQGRALGLEPEQGPRGAPAPGPAPGPAPARLRLNAPPVHDQRLIPSSPISSLSKLPYCYSPDLNSYLRPTEPDDQEMDYDNIWEYDQNTGMIQPTSGIPQQRTGLGLGARGLSAMATQQR
ncbi:uncharacterized protein plekhn1 [Gadus macrocephalus]|uniref:uncharacterized protein plekhn1 n=1 Tax=Gadus macrocephalus TaxID=80720 RepID=UPI0028CB6E03|nr:uncharacterized protein plekhn1 [Gadus macrocephalus]